MFKSKPPFSAACLPGFPRPRPIAAAETSSPSCLPKCIKTGFPSRIADILLGHTAGRPASLYLYQLLLC